MAVDLPPRPIIERPAVVLHEPPPPKPVAEEPPPVPRAPRPSVHVASLDGQPLPEPDARLSIPPEPAESPDDFEMVAPVEMWFGDSRVGVKEGSKTFDQFRRYADNLLEDLRESKHPS
jgi:hypothetical protein